MRMEREEQGLDEAAEAATDFVPVHCGHPDVEEHDVGSDFGDQSHPGAVVLCDASLAAELLDQHRQHPGSVNVVDDHGDPTRERACCFTAAHKGSGFASTGTDGR